MTINLDGLGEFTYNEDEEWFEGPFFNHQLGIKECRFLIYGDKSDDISIYASAMRNFLNFTTDNLKLCEEYLFQYYEDVKQLVEEGLFFDEESFFDISTTDVVWDYVGHGNEFLVSQRQRGDRAIYISWPCSCEWEEEHGLEIVLKEGKSITKVSSHDGHLTQSDAYDNDAFENVVYVRLKDVDI